MSQIIRKLCNINGQDIMMLPEEAEYNQRRILTLTGEINDEEAAKINSALRCLASDSDADIFLYIQSPGGSVTAGMSIYDTIRSLRCDVCTIASGMAASMGAFLLSAAGTKGKRYVQPNAEVLIHQPLGGVRGQETDIRKQAEYIMRTRAKLNRMLAEATGQTEEKINEDTERDNRMDAMAAVAYGLADHIGDPIAG